MLANVSFKVTNASRHLAAPPAAPGVRLLCSGSESTGLIIYIKHVSPSVSGSGGFGPDQYPSQKHNKLINELRSKA